MRSSRLGKRCHIERGCSGGKARGRRKWGIILFWFVCLLFLSFCVNVFRVFVVDLKLCFTDSKCLVAQVQLQCFPIESLCYLIFGFYEHFCFHARRSSNALPLHCQMLGRRPAPHRTADIVLLLGLLLLFLGILDLSLHIHIFPRSTIALHSSSLISLPATPVAAPSAARFTVPTNACRFTTASPTLIADSKGTYHAPLPSPPCIPSLALLFSLPISLVSTSTNSQAIRVFTRAKAQPQGAATHEPVYRNTFNAHHVMNNAAAYRMSIAYHVVCHLHTPA